MSEDYSKRELLDLIQPTKVWIAAVYAGDGCDDCLYAGATEERVYAKVANEFCKGQYWKTVMGDEPMPATDREIVEKFFEKAAYSGIAYHIDELDL